MDFGKRQIGNTVILKYKKGDLPFIKVSTVSGDFSVEYGAGSVMFMLLDNAPIEGRQSADAYNTQYAVCGKLH